MLLCALVACGTTLAATSQTVTLDTAAIRPTPPGTTNWRMEFSHGRMRIENRSVRDLVMAAYALSANSQVVNAPSWTLERHFDVSGTFDTSEAKEIDTGTVKQRDAMIAGMLRSLLAERFQLQAHEAQAILPVYALTVSRQGLKAKPTSAELPKTFHGIVGPPGRLEAHAADMGLLAARLTTLRNADERLVLDETSTPGTFDWALRWNANPMSEESSTSDLPPLNTALEEQLGLRLVSKKGKVRTVVVDQIEPPSDN